ncbi:lipase (class 3) domain-containing protein [Ditylenchus destructor]|uniref:Lipase (Class 3) domain-containing protein n=1 Tax=Ditylenchus destructor TaxID=166010 RepID=A0AAD4QWB9_9BILA|nr:lipase (class 3) domain-containing protein [Ditylenchus destructor]
MAAPQYLHCTAFLRMGSHTYTAPHSYEWAVTWFSRSHNTALIFHLDEGPSKLWEGRDNWPFIGRISSHISAAHVVNDSRYSSMPLKLFTLGEPRTGDKDFAQAIYETFPPNSTYRITHSRDPVVHLPSLSYRNYTHNIAEVWYHNSMAKDKTYTAICANDGESKNCSGQIHYVFSANDHIKYFGQRVSSFGIDGCVKKKN